MIQGPHLDIGVVSTYPPREDGIATFTRDLLDAVCKPRSGISARIAAITDPGAHYAYPRQVRWRIEQDDPESYAAAGHTLSRARVALVLLQHEFGLFGEWDERSGTLRDHVPAFLDALAKPLVTTLHTVIPRPPRSIRDAIRRLADKSASVVVMVHVAAKILAEDYGLDPCRLVTIPHGVPAVDPVDVTRAKRRVHLEKATVISTFGLLHRNKGLEVMIRAMPAITARHPDALYLIMGETHPQVRNKEGESYREELVHLARDLGMSRHVRFVNHYLSQASLIRYLQATDIYVTPYHDRSQITSGTISYALGCGRAIVSTAYVYAAEALAEGRGLLAEFDNPDSIAQCVNLYLDDPTFRCQTEQRALDYGREMVWSNVGAQYAALLRRVAWGEP